jgi:hypothetical protein
MTALNSDSNEAGSIFLIKHGQIKQRIVADATNQIVWVTFTFFASIILSTTNHPQLHFKKMLITQPYSRFSALYISRFVDTGQHHKVLLPLWFIRKSLPS